MYVKMLFYKGFCYSEVFQKDSAVRKVGSLPAVRTTYHPARTLIYPLFHPSRRCAIPSGCPDRPSIICQDDVDFRPNPSLHQEASVPVCICPDVSAARPDASQYSTKLQIPSMFSYRKIDATVRTTWIPVRIVFWPHSVFGQNHLSVKML